MKTRKIITIAVTAVAAGLAILSGIMKLSGGEEITTGMSKVGVGEYITLLGLMEIGFAALFIYPKTMKIGFLLLTCYFSGAIATELSHGTPFNAVMPLTVIWIAAFLREPAIFLPTPSNEKD